MNLYIIFCGSKSVAIMHVGAEKAVSTVHQFAKIVAAIHVNECQNWFSIRRLIIPCFWHSTVGDNFFESDNEDDSCDSKMEDFYGPIYNTHFLYVLILCLPLKTTPRRVNIFGCLNVLIISTSLQKSFSASFVAVSFKTLMATISGFSLFSASSFPVKDKKDLLEIVELCLEVKYVKFDY